MADTLLNVVDEQDLVIGQALRSEIHKQGLLHREVHVWFVMPDGDLVFQCRSPTKETYPNYLDATAGGHVELEQSYEEAALAEIREETGLELSLRDLIPLVKLRLSKHDEESGLTNSIFLMTFAYPFQGKLADLKVELRDGAGFVKLPFNEAIFGNSEVARRVLPRVFMGAYEAVWEILKNKNL